MLMEVFHTDALDGIAQLLTLILILIFVVLLAYFTVRFTGKFQENMLKNSNFKVVDTYRVSNSQYLQIVRVANKCVVIGISKDNITFITEVDEEQLKQRQNELPQNVNFSEIFTKLKEKKK